MKNLDTLIKDLSSKPELLKALASDLLTKIPTSLDELISLFKEMGYEIDKQKLKDKIMEIGKKDKNKENKLIQHWLKVL